MESEIAERFQVGAGYDRMIRNVFPAYDVLPLITLSYLRTKVGRQARVLDVGCGTGASLVVYAAKQPDWSLVGVDPTSPMVAVAQAKLDELGVGDRVTVMVGKVDDLPAEERFDAASMILVEHLLPDDGSKSTLLQSIAARLRPGGWLVMAGLHGDLATASSQLALDAWIEYLAASGLPPDAQSGVRQKATKEDSLVSEERIRELLGQAGFSSIERIYQLHLLGGWLAQRS